MARPRFSATLRRVGKVVLVTVTNNSGSRRRALLSGVAEGDQVITVDGNHAYRGVWSSTGRVEVTAMDPDATTLAVLDPPEEP